MKKNLRFMFAALLMMFGMTAMAQEVTLDFATNDWGLPTDYTTAAGTYTNADNYTITFGESNNGHKYNVDAHYVIWGKQGATLTLPAFNFDVERIDVTGREGASGNTLQNFYVGELAVSTETKGVTGKNSYIIADAYQAAGNVYVLKINSNHNSQITKIEIFKKGEAGVPEPTITPNGGDFEEQVTVTINAIEGATIYYALNKADFQAYAAPFTLTETTTVTAYAEKDGKQSATVEATFTKQEPAQAIVATCAEIINGTDGTVYQVKGKCTEITNTTYGNWTLEDETGTIVIYGTLDAEGKTKNFASLGIEVGDIVTVKGPRKDYNGTIELIDVTVIEIEKGSGPGPIDPVELEGDGTKENPYTVADVKAIKEFPADKVWVKGFIVGSIKNNAVEETPTQYSNIAIAAEPGITEWASVVPVQLVNNTDPRVQLNVVDNPGNIGKAVKLLGTIATYFNTNGVKEVSEFEMENSTAISSVKAASEQGVIYNLQGQQVMQPTKGLYIINGKKVVIK